MTKQEVLDALLPLSASQQMGWLVDFGMLLTIAARASYSIQGEPGNLAHLMAFNEIQHRVYGCMQHLPQGTEWPMEDFLGGLISRARQGGVEGDFGWALKTSIERTRHSLGG